MLTTGQLERHVKGIASHRRIKIMLLLSKYPGLPLIEISQRLKFNFKTTAEHVRRLQSAGLITKKRRSAIVEHNLTKRGEVFLKFLKNLE